jgi:hypothetical protein
VHNNFLCRPIYQLLTPYATDPEKSGEYTNDGTLIPPSNQVFLPPRSGRLLAPPVVGWPPLSELKMMMLLSVIPLHWHPELP